LPTTSGNEKTLFGASHSEDVDSSRSNWGVHLNLSSLNGCFFNFGPRSLSSLNFPFKKE
jgi:hypothetical protein